MDLIRLCYQISDSMSTNVVYMCRRFVALTWTLIAGGTVLAIVVAPNTGCPPVALKDDDAFV